MSGAASRLLTSGLAGPRIAVAGIPGGGKSTLARAIGDALDLPVHHVDDLAWRPGWQARDPDEVSRDVAALAESDTWIIEGNHLASMPCRISRASAVIIVDAPLPVAWARIVRRSAAARAGRPTLLPAPVRDEPEPWRCRRIVMRAAWRYHRHTLPSLCALLASRPPQRIYRVDWPARVLATPTEV